MYQLSLITSKLQWKWREFSSQNTNTRNISGEEEKQSKPYNLQFWLLLKFGAIYEDSDQTISNFYLIYIHTEFLNSVSKTAHNFYSLYQCKTSKTEQMPISLYFLLCTQIEVSYYIFLSNSIISLQWKTNIKILTNLQLHKEKQIPGLLCT